VPSSSPTICLIDDEPSVLKALGRLLASEGWKTEKFEDPVLFLDYSRSNAVALAVIDVRMPGMSGLDVQVALHETSPGSRTIIITAEDDPAHRLAAKKGGATAFFLKPLDDDAFVEAVRNAMPEVA